jgi:hypothetical protein
MSFWDNLKIRRLLCSVKAKNGASFQPEEVQSGQAGHHSLQICEKCKIFSDELPAGIRFFVPKPVTEAISVM